MGVSNLDLGFLTNALIDGAYVGDYFLDGKKIDLSLRGEDRFSGSTSDVRALPIATPDGRLIPLEAIANVDNFTVVFVPCLFTLALQGRSSIQSLFGGGDGDQKSSVLNTPPSIRDDAKTTELAESV